ncbi:PAS domain-containing protein [Hymenobacter metallilatus]|uniref:Sensory/regulatory protein RpfC n=1 Tax=Hymenobacter metallilatus TaxID=2493666 RepID=A0A3R9NQI3_9BACT|nr:PAS domain-containing protein [Hymenobacter metallilatus]RSK34586.1 PAS domain S-box protein [Hymenobacter metallilatus]
MVPTTPPPALPDPLLLQVADHLPDGLLLVDANDCVLLVNAQYCTLWGLPAEPARWQGRPVAELRAAALPLLADPTEALRQREQLRAAPQPRHRSPLPLTDGRILEIDYVPLPTGTLVYARDVTAREQALDELRDISSIPLQNPNPIVRLGAGGEQLFANEAANSFQAALPPQEADALNGRLHALALAALRAGAVQEQELTGGTRHFQVVARPVPERQYVNLYLVDISARYQAEQQLDQQRIFYETLLDALPVEVVVLDEQQRYVYTNPAAVPDAAQRAWLPGHTLSEYASTYRLQLAELGQLRETYFQEALRTAEALPTWEEASAGSGETHYFLRSYRRLPAVAGAPLRVLGYGLDVTAHHRAEQRVAEQRAFYEAILNTLPSQVAVLDAQGRYLFMNARGMPNTAARQAILGHTVAEFTARLGWPPAVAERRAGYFRQALTSGEPQVWQEATTNPANRQPQHFLRHYQPVLSTAGQLQFVIAYGTDITARVAAEEALRQSEERLREQQQFQQLVLDTTPDPVYVRDTEGQIIFGNYALELLKEATIRLQTLAEQYPDGPEAAELAHYSSADAQVLATGAEVRTEDRLTMPDGQVRWYQTIKRPLTRSDGTTHILGVSTDITALKEAQQTLEYNQKRYHDLMHYAQALICTYDMQGIVQSVNPALARLLGRAESELLGRPVQASLLPADQADFSAYLARIAAEGEAQGVLRIQPLGHEQLHFLLYHNFVVREAGQPPYIISHAQDITERVQAEEEMKRAKEAAEAAAQARANFLANMSHEIRTPLNGVLGMAALLAKTRLTTQQREQVQIIRSSGRHLLGVINDVLDVAKITSGKVELEQQPFHLCDAVGEALQPLLLQAEQKGLLFHTRSLHDSCPHPWVLGDAQRLNQVLINLVSNAIKFTPIGGQVSVAGRVAAETATSLTVEFQVADTGIGIAANKLNSIFDSFTQAYADTARQFGGTGLGLAISRALVEQMGGRLTVTSQPDQGSTFTFQLTLPKAEEPARPATAAPLTNVLQGLHVLLVEDNAINRLVARQMIEAWGGTVTEAVDGPVALALFEEQAFDIVLMDIQLPGLSGLDVTLQLRRHPNPQRAATPILALTANAYASDAQQYLAAGMNDFLAKPFDEEELCRKLLALRPPASRPYDLSRFQALAHGNAAFVPAVIRHFLTDIPPALAQLHAALEAGSWPEVGRLVHYIKPNLEALSIADTAGPLATLETVRLLEPGTGAEEEVLRQAVRQLHAAVEAVLPPLAQELAGME